MQWGNISPPTCCVCKGGLHPENDWVGPWDILTLPSQVASWLPLLLLFFFFLTNLKEVKNKSKVQNTLSLLNCVANYLLFGLSFLCPSLRAGAPQGFLFWPLASASSYSLGSPGRFNPLPTIDTDDPIQATPDPRTHYLPDILTRISRRCSMLRTPSYEFIIS